ncbi:MAG: hypothetical protein AAGF30_02445 [Pseudomonadota bacterium]
MKETLINKLSSTIAAAASMIGVVAALASIGFLYGDIQEAQTQKTQEDVSYQLEVQIRKEIDSLRAEIQGAISDVLDETQLPEGTEVAVRFQQIEGTLNQISQKLRIIETIEVAVTDNPERAMSIPILRRDIDVLRTDVTEDLGIVRAEIDRIYDLGKWFIGLIATMAIGVLGLAVGNLIKGKE